MWWISLADGVPLQGHAAYVPAAAGQQCQWIHSGNEPDSHRHWSIGRSGRRSLEAAVGSASFQAARRLRHRSAGVQILFPAHDDDSRQRDRLDLALAVSALIRLTQLLHVAEQQTRGEKEKRSERGGQERERSHFEYPRMSCGPRFFRALWAAYS